MNTLAKKQYTDIITGMGKKKTDLDKALAYYKINKATTIINQANQLGVGNIRIKINRRDGTTQTTKLKPSNEPQSLYANKVREQIVKKWKNDTQEYYATYKMKFKTYNSRSKKMVNVVIPITIRGTKDALLINALAEYNIRVQQYQRQYPENDSYDFDENYEGLIPIPDGEKYNVRSNYVETSVSGGQRKVGKKGVKRNMRMKSVGYLKISDDKQEWNTNQDCCVFDYLYWKYKNDVGFKKAFGKSKEDAYDFLNNLFMDEDDEDELNPITQGVSVKQLEKFCDRFGTNMYAFDKNNELIQHYESKKSFKGEVLIFKVFDNHFYPVVDKTERKSLQGKATIINPRNPSSSDIENHNSTKEKSKKIVIAPTEEEFAILKGDEIDYLSIQNRYALDYIKKNEGKIPFPLQPKNIHITDATIHKLNYDDKIVLTKPIDKMVEKFYNDNTEIGYQGESTLDITKYIWKKKYNIELAKSRFWSKPNQQVAEVLNAENVKWRTHIGKMSNTYDAEKIREMLQDGRAIAADITKCYCDAIYNQREKFIVFNGKEIMEEYDGKLLTLGLYFVETDDMNLFHKSNWYSKAIIDLAKQENISYRITRQIRCVDEDWYDRKVETDDDGNETLIYELNNKELFKSWCDDVIELTEQDEDFTLTKQVINNITGSIGKTSTSYKEVGLSKNLDEVWEDWLVPEVQEKPKFNAYINTIANEDTKLYLYGIEGKTNSLSNGLPMYIQVLDWSNMALYNLGKDVGGEIIYRKTDCIVSVGGKIPEDKEIKYPCSYVDTFGKYHLEDTEKALLFNYDLLMNTNRYVATPKLDDDWIDYKQFKSSDDWEGIIKTAIEKGGMLIEGRAGVGKSYIIDKGIQLGLLPEDNESRLAYTNRAARNINGTTIHKAMAINKEFKTNSKTLEHLKKYKIIVIDEIGMINAEIWNMIMLLKKTTKAIFIVMGDFRQCPPIEEGAEIDYFNHPYVKRLVNNNRCQLTKPQRYDMALWDWLEDFYENGIEGNEIKKKKLTIDNILYSKNICYRNLTRNAINNVCMDYFKKEKAYIPLIVPEKCNNKYADTAYIYKGLPIMAVVANKELGIINSEEFWVKEFSSSNSNMTIYRDEDNTAEFTIEFKVFHKYFVVNYAATAHKSQGATISKPINIFDWDYMITDFNGNPDRRVGYTAISRGKTCDQISIYTDSRETKVSPTTPSL
jgi:thymidine kinase